jgi:hypothetical protein
MTILQEIFWELVLLSPAFRIAGKLAKTVAISSVGFINDEEHLDSMEIRDALEGKEHRYTGDGEEIVCPICGTAWLKAS